MHKDDGITQKVKFWECYFLPKEEWIESFDTNSNPGLKTEKK
jgi:hypothetical protein